MQITWQGVTYKSGKHIPQEELKAGMVVMCGDDEHKASCCWRAPAKPEDEEEVLAPFVMVACKGNKVGSGFKKLPVGFTEYYDESCDSS